MNHLFRSVIRLSIFCIACSATCAVQGGNKQGAKKLAAFSHPSGAARALDSTGRESVLHLGFLYPLSSNGREAVNYSNLVSVHALAGVSARERSFTLSGISSIVGGEASGVQVAGISNHIGGNVRGLQLAGLLNRVGGEARGMQAAGLLNLNRQVRGVQLSGLLNRAHSVQGGQLAGLVNRSGDIKGLQVAGLVNKAGKVRGIQLAGLVNIADSSDYSLALVNVIKNGEISIGTSTDETFNALLDFRSGGRIVYGVVQLGYNLQSEDDLYAFGGGLGAHLKLSRHIRLSPELGTLILEDFHRGEYSKHYFRALTGFRLSPQLEVFAGPSLNFVITDMDSGRSLADNTLWEKERSNGNLHQWYIGFAGGLRWIL